MVNKAIFISQENCKPEDNYTFTKTLGEGSYGVVVKGIHKLTKATRAIKIIKKHGDDKDKDIENEINMLTMLDHPNVIKIFEFYNANKEYYLVTEFCQGGELFDKIINAAPLSEEFSALLMYQIFSAVYYCHKMGVIHRDLKPENILLTGNEMTTILKIVDFGTAKIFDKNHNERRVVGSYYYMAPEVISKNYNEKCDLWSCGVIMYILLTGEPPFGGSDQEIVKKIIVGKYNTGNKNIAGRSSNCTDLLSKLLVKNPKERISAEDALIHPWFQDYNIKSKYNNINGKKIRKLINNILNYNPGFVIQQAALGFLVHNNPQLDDIIDASKLFNLIDTNGDGIIEKNELYEGLINMLKSDEDNRLKNDVDKIFGILDSDNNGYLEYGEFVRAAINRKIFLNSNYLMFAFNHFDKNKSGSINLSEIKEVFGKYKENIEQNFQKIISEVDLNGDGNISFTEFEEIMKLILK